MYLHEAEVDHNHHQCLRSKAAQVKGWITLDYFVKQFHSIGYPHIQFEIVSMHAPQEVYLKIV